MTRSVFLTVLVAAFLLFAGSLANAANPKVLMKTSKGDITLELYADKAPITVKNFLAYVDAKFYDGTIFHRVIKGFMIQGGGLNAELSQKQARPPIKNEAANGLKNNRGTIAMARTGEIDSATCQFFINHNNNDNLNHIPNNPERYGYCVFGQVTAGMEVVDAIANSPTMTTHGTKDVPRETITIVSVQRL
jgi:peptidyl-prolyl cis-trans isomerase A (cyclophilin A)